MKLGSRQPRGFSLLELMIVVAIIAVLAVIAVVSFSRLKRRAVRSEVASVLGAISLRQETFRAEYSTYKTCSGAAPALNTSPGTEPIKKNVTKPPCWTSLGLTTDPALYCSYTIYGGNATSWNLARQSDDNGSATVLPAPDQVAFSSTVPTVAWYLAKAECDLDSDGAAAGNNSIFYRTQFSSGLAERNPDR